MDTKKRDRWPRFFFEERSDEWNYQLDLVTPGIIP